jgi:hypothetical protein
MFSHPLPSRDLGLADDAIVMIGVTVGAKKNQILKDAVGGIFIDVMDLMAGSVQSPACRIGASIAALVTHLVLKRLRD